MSQRDSKRARSKVASSNDAKRLLESAATSALALVVAAKQLLGAEFLHWEPETIWLALEEAGVPVSEVNAAKIQSAITLLFVPSFYWDAVVYEKTAIAFAGTLPNPDSLQEATPAELAWAVKEAEAIMTHHGEVAPALDHEPEHYTAVVLHRAGMVLPPEELSFAEAGLDSLNKDTATLKKQVKEAVAIGNLLDRALTESPLDVQLARLAAVKLHVQDRQHAQSSELAALAA